MSKRVDSSNCLEITDRIHPGDPILPIPEVAVHADRQ